jgi:hypothetical protein
MAAVVSLGAPAGASAGSMTITQDDGAAVPLAGTGPTLRHLAPLVAAQFASGEQRYTLTVTGPDGQPSITSSTCLRTSSYSGPDKVRYAGNGTYTAVLQTWKAADDFSCEGAATTTRATFTTASSTAVGLDPAKTLLTRLPTSFATLDHTAPVVPVPGADSYEVYASPNPALAPDGSLVGPAERALVDSAQAVASLRFPGPGTWHVVARARTFSGRVDGTPWSPPVAVRVVAPFDVLTSSFPDSRGPVYKLRVTLRERTARGRVRVSVARRWKGKARYRSLGRAKLGKRATFTKRFRLRRPGKYRLRLRFGGSATTAPGTLVNKIQARRTVRFSAAGTRGGF